MFMAWIAGLKRVRLGVYLQHQIDDIDERRVCRMGDILTADFRPSRRQGKGQRR
jgi:hypothetical protein